MLEKALAEKAGLGWIGKHSNLLDREAGSWFFLGEIYTDLPLPLDEPQRNHCGDCTRCIDSLPDRRDRGALPGRCASLYFLSDHRTANLNSGIVKAINGQPDLRMR